MSQKKLSLQDQLLQAGLVSSAKARSTKTEKYKQSQQQRNSKAQAADEARELALKAQAEKLERDRELNRIKQEQEERRQTAAQIKQLVQQHRIPIDENEIDQYDDSSAYHFTDNNKIKKLFVPPQMRAQIAGGRLAIVKAGQRYEVVAADIAEKIKERNASAVMVFNGLNQEPDKTDDPYADYQIPDDLMW